MARYAQLGARMLAPSDMTIPHRRTFREHVQHGLLELGELLRDGKSVFPLVHHLLVIRFLYVPGRFHLSFTAYGWFVVEKDDVSSLLEVSQLTSNASSSGNQQYFQHMPSLLREFRDEDVEQLSGETSMTPLAVMGSRFCVKRAFVTTYITPAPRLWTRKGA